MSLLVSCQKYFANRNLYAVLNVKKSSSTKEIKKAYHRLSLQFHPDKTGSTSNPEQESYNTERFQTLGRVYALLSNDDRRKLYDDCGEVDDDVDLSDGVDDWLAYWRLLFPTVTTKDIENFEIKYKNSEDELLDIKAAYKASVGDMGGVLDRVLCASVEDEPRIRAIIDRCIAAGEIRSYDAYTNESQRSKGARLKRAQMEKREWEQEIGERGAAEELVARIQRNAGMRMGSIIERLENKYAKQPAKKKAKVDRSNGGGGGSAVKITGSAGKVTGSAGKGTGSAVKVTGSVGKGKSSAVKVTGSAGKVTRSAVKVTGSAGKVRGSAGKGTGSVGKVTGSAGKVTDSVGKGTGSAGKGTGSAGKGTGSAGKGTGSAGRVTGPADKGTGSAVKGTGSTGRAVGSSKKKGKRS